ncbi:MAG TPA: hypothetical protein VJ885_19135 [Thermoanaerobaculia bacterium]|nr:hypothetical protein [Thermoanaerobaculia bacterium]
MPNRKDRPPGKGISWLVDHIVASVQANGNPPASRLSSPRLTREEIDALVAKKLDEELERLEREEE